MYSFRNILKYANLFLFLFLLCELAYGGVQYNPVMPVVRKVVLVIGLLYTVFYVNILPIYLRVILAVTACLVLNLIGESVDRYGTWMESVNFTSMLLYPVLTGGAFVACLWIRQLRIDYIVNTILILFFINQIVLGRIMDHHFNSEERSMTAPEVYYLMIPLIYYLNTFLLNGKTRSLYYFVAIAALIIFCFHRTVWMTALVATALNCYLMRSYSVVPFSTIAVRLTPLLACILLVTGPLLYLKPELIDSVMDSVSDIQNANQQGTGGWRSEQRDIYMSLVPEHPFLGWTYEGYDKGEVMATEGSEEWKGAKGTFIHSAYVYTLYNFGVIGLLLQFGLILLTSIKFYKIFNRQDPGQWALFIFISSAWVYAWSYQLPELYWGFLGVCVYFIYHAQRALRRRYQPITQEEVGHFEPEFV